MDKYDKIVLIQVKGIKIMRRDVSYFFNTDVVTLFNAYLMASKNAPFERSCNEEPYHTFSFGLNFSMKYNMNGGSCTLHFIPYADGAAVDLRFTLAQLVGARYEAYAKDLTMKASEILRISPQKLDIAIDLFVKPENKVCVSDVQTAARPSSPQPEINFQNIQPTSGNPVETNFVKTSFCTECGRQIIPHAKFCAGCGAPVQQENNCKNCGQKLPADAIFCPMCGTKQ